MGTGNDAYHDSPFAAILRGEEPGTIIVRDDDKRFALIASMEPEAAIHWLAIPFESGYSTAEMKDSHSDRFLALLDFAIRETRARVTDHPELMNGFTVKFHCGAYETVPHAKFHVLSIE